MLADGGVSKCTARKLKYDTPVTFATQIVRDARVASDNVLLFIG